MGQIISQDLSSFEVLKIQMQPRPAVLVLPKSPISKVKRCHKLLHSGGYPKGGTTMGYLDNGVLADRPGPGCREESSDL